MVAVVALVALFLYAQHRYPINWRQVLNEFVHVDWRRIVIAILCIYVGYIFRALRWTYLLRHNKRVPAFSLIGTQVIGFTAVALIGRVADPVRPYLVAKKTSLPLGNQIAVYIVERLCDFGTMALFFSLAMLQIAPGAIAGNQIATTHHAHFAAGFEQHFPNLAPIMEKFGGLIITGIAALFLLAIRVAGDSVASLLEVALRPISRKLGEAIAGKIRAFRSGLDTIRSLADFSVTFGLSLAMWSLITYSYLSTTRAFPASHELSGMSFSKCILLMAISGGASVLQLPVFGWFTQTLAVMAALVAGFGVAREPATACAAMILIVTFLSVVPIGLIWAQVDNISLRTVTVESERAEENLEAAKAAE